MCYLCSLKSAGRFVIANTIIILILKTHYFLNTFSFCIWIAPGWAYVQISSTWFIIKPSLLHIPQAYHLTEANRRRPGRVVSPEGGQGSKVTCNSSYMHLQTCKWDQESDTLQYTFFVLDVCSNQTNDLSPWSQPLIQRFWCRHLSGMFETFSAIQCY